MVRNLQRELEETERALTTISTLSEISGYQELCRTLIDSRYDPPVIFEPLNIEAFIAEVLELEEVKNRTGIYA